VITTVLFGIMALALPGLTLVALVLLYGFYTLVDGKRARSCNLNPGPFPPPKAGFVGALRA